MKTNVSSTIGKAGRLGVAAIVALIGGTAGAATDIDITTLSGAVDSLDLVGTNPSGSYSTASLTFQSVLNPALASYPNVLCFANGTGPYDLQFQDRSGYMRRVEGFGNLVYRANTGSVEASGGAVRCLSLPPAALPMEALAEFDAGTFCNAAQSQGVTPPGDFIHASGFEDGEGSDPSGSGDVRLAVDLIESPNPNAVDGPLVYDMYAFNCGADPATVTLRDFAPIDNPGNPTNTDVGLFTNQPAVTCSTSDASPCAVGFVKTANGQDTPYVSVTEAIPGAGGYLRVRVERAPVGKPGDIARLSFAVDTLDDVSLGDNGFHATITSIDNLAPDIAFSASGMMMIDEDDPTGMVVTRDDPNAEPGEDQPVPVEFSVIDQDSPADDIAAVEVVEIDELGVELAVADPAAKLAGMDISSTSYGGPIPYPVASPAGAFRVTLMPKPDASGAANIRIKVTDTGGSLQTADREVMIREINDAPAFSVAFLSNRQTSKVMKSTLGTEEVVIGTEYCEASGTAFIGARPNCDQTYPLSDADQTVVVLNWLTGIDEGAESTAEDAQSLDLVQFDPNAAGYPASPVEVLHDLKTGALDLIEMAILDDSGQPVAVAGSIFRQNPQLQDFDGNGSYDLFLDFRGITGVANLRMQVVDDGGTALNGLDTTDVTIRIAVVDNLPPDVAVIGSPAAIFEDDLNVELSGFTLSASDAEGSVNNVAVTSTDQALIADGDISVDFSNLADIKITVSPQADAFDAAGVDLAVVATDDGGNASAPLLITVPITGINDEPTVVFGDELAIEADNNVTDFDPSGPTLTISNDSGTSIAFVPGLILATGDSVMGPNEGAQSLQSVSVSIQSDPGNVFSGAVTPSIDESDGSFFYVLNSAAVTSPPGSPALLQITVTDNGGTANGGDDTSQTVLLQVVVVD